MATLALQGWPEQDQVLLWLSYIGTEASIEILREDFAMWRREHVVMSCGYFKNCQPTASERPPLHSLLFGISCTAEHRNVTAIRPGDVLTIGQNAKAIVVAEPTLVRDGTPLSDPQ